jgi:hypothetical protein
MLVDAGVSWDWDCMVLGAARAAARGTEFRVFQAAVITFCDVLNVLGEPVAGWETAVFEWDAQLQACLRVRSGSRDAMRAVMLGKVMLLLQRLVGRVEKPVGLFQFLVTGLKFSVRATVHVHTHVVTCMADVACSVLMDLLGSALQASRLGRRLDLATAAAAMPSWLSLLGRGMIHMASLLVKDTTGVDAVLISRAVSRAVLTCKCVLPVRVVPGPVGDVKQMVWDVCDFVGVDADSLVLAVGGVSQAEAGCTTAFAQALGEAGAALGRLATLLACNNPLCWSLARGSEWQMVGRGKHKCGDCRLVRYCCPDCQRAHRAAHILVCRKVNPDYARRAERPRSISLWGDIGS